MMDKGKLGNVLNATMTASRGKYLVFGINENIIRQAPPTRDIKVISSYTANLRPE